MILGAGDDKKRGAKGSFFARLRTNFLTGIVVAAPIAITIYLTWAFVNFVDARIIPLLPRAYNPATYLPFSVPGFGLVVFFFFTAALGALAKNFFGRQLFLLGERLVDRMPVVRSLYTTLKQIVETVFSQAQGANSFRQVCLIEYPRRGLYAIAFVTTDTVGEIPVKSGEPSMISVFLPTTPNPTSGFLLFVPRDDAILLDMSVEDAAKLVISAGLVNPADLESGKLKSAEPEAGPVLEPVPERPPSEDIPARKRRPFSEPIS